MADRFQIEIRISGEGFSAERLNPNQVADFLRAVSSLFSAIVSRDYPQLGISEEDVVVGLSSIQQGSLIATFVTPYEEAVAHASKLTGYALQNTDYSSLPIDSIKALHKLRKFSRSNNVVTEFWERNGSPKQLAALTAQTPITAESFTIRGKTTLYGTLVRVGGEDPPRAVIRFIDGTRRSCRVGGLKLARKLGQKLYERVGVRGMAIWDRRDMSLHEFRIEEVLDYSETPIQQAMDALARVTAHHYAEVDDLVELVRDIRGTDEEMP